MKEAIPQIVTPLDNEQVLNAWKSKICYYVAHFEPHRGHTVNPACYQRAKLAKTRDVKTIFEAWYKKTSKLVDKEWRRHVQVVAFATSVKKLFDSPTLRNIVRDRKEYPPFPTATSASRFVNYSETGTSKWDVPIESMSDSESLDSFILTERSYDSSTTCESETGSVASNCSGFLVSPVKETPAPPKDKDITPTCSTLEIKQNLLAESSDASSTNISIPKRGGRFRGRGGTNRGTQPDKTNSKDSLMSHPVLKHYADSELLLEILNNEIICPSSPYYRYPIKSCLDFLLEVYTDCEALTHLNSVKDPSSRLTRFALKLQEYDLVIKYRPGKKNVGPDYLSRNPVGEAPNEEVDDSLALFNIQSFDLPKLQREDKELSKIFQAIEHPVSMSAHEARMSRRQDKKKCTEEAQKGNEEKQNNRQNKLVGYEGLRQDRNYSKYEGNSSNFQTQKHQEINTIQNKGENNESKLKENKKYYDSRETLIDMNSSNESAMSHENSKDTNIEVRDTMKTLRTPTFRYSLPRETGNKPILEFNL
ncbi:hypothetical protein WDU94_010660 [Cyamophila willieti]